MYSPTIWVKRLKELERGPNQDKWRVKVYSEGARYPDRIYYYEPHAKSLEVTLETAAHQYACALGIEGVYLMAYERYNKCAAVFVPRRRYNRHTFWGFKS